MTKPKLLVVDVWGSETPVIFRDVEFVGLGPKGEIVGRWPIHAMNTAEVMRRLK